MANSKLISVALTLLLVTGCADLRTTTIRASVTESIGTYQRYVGGTNYGGGTLGRVELDVPLISRSGFSLGAVVSHESLLDTSHDVGDNRAGLALAYQPWGAR